MSVPSVDLEMQPPAHPLPTATGGDEEEGQQCWRDVEAETGFRSYRSFLEALPATGPQYKDLLEGIDPKASFGEIQVLNILKDGGVSIGMNLRGLGEDTRAPHLGERNSDLTKDCTLLLRNLRSPPDNSCARIVVWSIPRDSSLRSGLVAAFGLGLKIQPAVLGTLSSIARGDFRRTSSRSLRPDYVVIGNSIATVARNYVPNKRVAPVLFVAKVNRINTEFLRRSQDLVFDYDDMVKEALTSEIYGSIPLFHPASDMRSLKDLAPESFEYLDRLSNHVYLNVLSKNVQKCADVDAQSDGPLLNAILPLLRLEVSYLHAQCQITQRTLLLAQKYSERYQDGAKQVTYSALGGQRFWLRRKLEELKESRSRFVNFARLQNAPKWLDEQSWLSQEEEIIEAVSEARAVETEARDHLQLLIGNLSMEESRKSIQLSSQQMSEAKRVKIFTILAFIYVPINLATSVFGMNLQELNQNGQRVWSFVVTAIVALLITGFVWVSLGLYNVVRESKHRVEEVMFRGFREPIPRIGVRIAWFLGLINEYELRLMSMRDFRA